MNDDANRSDKAGFSMLEALVATAVLGAMLLAVSSLITSNRRSFDRGNARIEVQQNGRIAIQTISRELRHAGYDPSDMLSTLTPVAAIQVGKTAELTFVGDVDANRVNDRITYRFQSSQLSRTYASWTGSAFSGSQTDVLADGIAGLAFGYFDQNDVALSAPLSNADLPKVRRITVGLATAENTLQGTNEAFRINTEVRLRNQ